MGDLLSVFHVDSRSVSRNRGLKQNSVTNAQTMSHELMAHKYKMTRFSFIVRTSFDNM